MPNIGVQVHRKGKQRKMSPRRYHERVLLWNKYTGKLESVARKSSIRISMPYRTVSKEAITVITE